jgi:hypothetical protein
MDHKKWGMELSHLKNSIFWDITPCSSAKFNRHLETYRLHFQGRTVSLSQARNHHVTGTDSECGTVVGICDHGYEPLGSIRDGKFLE